MKTTDDYLKQLITGALPSPQTLASIRRSIMAQTPHTEVTGQVTCIFARAFAPLENWRLHAGKHLS